MRQPDIVKRIATVLKRGSRTAKQVADFLDVTANHVQHVLNAHQDLFEIDQPSQSRLPATWKLKDQTDDQRTD